MTNSRNLLIGVSLALLAAVVIVVGWRVNQDAPLRLALAVDQPPALRNPVELALQPDPNQAVNWFELQAYDFNLAGTADVITVRIDQAESVLALVGPVNPPDHGCAAGMPATHERQYRNGDPVRVYTCAPHALADVRITLLDGLVVGAVYDVPAVQAGAPTAALMLLPTPTPPSRPAKPFNVLATRYGGGADSVGVSWATPPDNAGVVAEGYRVERRECRSYPGGEYSTTTTNGAGLIVTITITLPVPIPPDATLCGDGAVSDLDPANPTLFNPEWAPWGTIYDGTDSALTHAIDNNSFPPTGSDAWSVRYEYRVVAFGAGAPSENSEPPHAPADIDRSP